MGEPSEGSAAVFGPIGKQAAQFTWLIVDVFLLLVLLLFFTFFKELSADAAVRQLFPLLLVYVIGHFLLSGLHLLAYHRHDDSQMIATENARLIGKLSAELITKQIAELNAALIASQNAKLIATQIDALKTEPNTEPKYKQFPAKGSYAIYGLKGLWFIAFVWLAIRRGIVPWF